MYKHVLTATATVQTQHPVLQLHMKIHFIQTYEPALFFSSVVNLDVTKTRSFGTRCLCPACIPPHVPVLTRQTLHAAAYQFNIVLTQVECT